MNVLFVSHYSELYGANRSLLALLDGLNNSSITPFVVIPQHGGIVKALEKRGITYFILPFKNWMAKSRLKMPFRLLMNLMLIPILLWKLNKWKINLVYTNSSVTPIGAWVAYILKLPHIWHIREFGWEDYRLKHDFGKKIFNYWLNQSNKLIAVSYIVRDKVLKNMKKKTIVVYNGVIFKEEALKLLNNQREKGNRFIFGIIGVLHPTKGQEDAIRAFSRINEENETELWIAGSGSKTYKEYLQDLCEELKIHEKVKFLGYVNNPFHFFAKVDVVLVCSKNEAMGRVTAEAMVAGRPVIGLDNAGTSELIDSGVNGILYKGSIESLALKMESSLKKDLNNILDYDREKELNNFWIENYSAKIEKEIMSFK